MRRLSYIYIVLALLLCARYDLSAQSVVADLDSTTIFIGGQVGMNVKASYPVGANVVYHELEKLTDEIEIVETLPVDTVVENDIVYLTQRYLLTSFDTGLFYIPPVEILELEDGTKTSTSDLALNVVNPFQTLSVDEESQTVNICDVKTVKDAPFKLSELLQYWYVLLLVIGVPLLIVVAILGYFYWRSRHRKEVAEARVKEACDVVALRELEQIKEEKLWQSNQFKVYYSSITDTLRRYVSARYSVNALESTTDEIMDSIDDLLKDANGAYMAECRVKLRSVLEQADLVKFAKHEPMPNENEEAMQYAVEFVNLTREVVNVSEEGKEENK